MNMSGKDSTKNQSRAVVFAARYLAIAALLALLCVEGYYIVLLRTTIKKQAEDLRSISLQLQNYRSEKEGLMEELSAARKHAGESDNGNTAQR